MWNPSSSSCFFRNKNNNNKLKIKNFKFSQTTKNPTFSPQKFNQFQNSSVNKFYWAEPSGELSQAEHSLTYHQHHLPPENWVERLKKEQSSAELNRQRQRLGSKPSYLVVYLRKPFFITSFASECMQLSWTVCVYVAWNTHRGQLNAERQTHLIPDCTFVRLFVWLAGLEDRRCCCWWWKPVRKHVCQLHCCCSCSCCCYQQPRRQRLPSEMKQTKKW